MIPLTQVAKNDRIRSLLLEAQAKRIMEGAKSKRDERIRMFRPIVELKPGKEFGWCNWSDAQKMVDDGLAKWAWQGRMLVVGNLSSGIRDRSCSLSGVSRGHEPRTTIEMVERGPGRDGVMRYSRRRVTVVTDGDPMKDPFAGDIVLDPCLSPLEATALDPKSSGALLDHLKTQTMAGLVAS